MSEEIPEDIQAIIDNVGKSSKKIEDFHVIGSGPFLDEFGGSPAIRKMYDMESKDFGWSDVVKVFEKLSPTINNNNLIPSCFSAERYAASRELTKSEWKAQLNERRKMAFTIQIIEECRGSLICDAGDSESIDRFEGVAQSLQWHLSTKALPTIRALDDSFILDVTGEARESKAEGGGTQTELGYMPSFNLEPGDTVRPLRFGDIDSIYEAAGINQDRSCSHLDSEFDSVAYRLQNIAMAGNDINPVKYHKQGDIHLKVSLIASNEKIVEDLLGVVEQYRRGMSIAEPNKAPTEVNISKLAEYQVLLYWDLMLWSSCANVIIKKSTLATIMFPHGEKGPDEIRSYVKPFCIDVIHTTFTGSL